MFDDLLLNQLSPWDSLYNGYVDGLQTYTDTVNMGVIDPWDSSQYYGYGYVDGLQTYNDVFSMAANPVIIEPTDFGGGLGSYDFGGGFGS